MTAPAARSRATGNSSLSGTVALNARLPQVVGRPAAWMLSLMEIGIPSSVERGLPVASSVSLALAAVRAPASSQATKLLSCGLSRRMRSRERSSSASAVSEPLRNAAASSEMFSFVSSMSITLQRLADRGRQLGGTAESREYDECDHIGGHLDDVGADRYTKTLQPQLESLCGAENEAGCRCRPGIPSPDDQRRQRQIAPPA